MKYMLKTLRDFFVLNSQYIAIFIAISHKMSQYIAILFFWWYPPLAFRELISCTDPFSIIYFLFFFLSSSVTLFFSFYPVPIPSVNWIGHEAAILPSMCEYSCPDPDLIKLPHKILSGIRTDSCLYSVGPSYKMTDRTAGLLIFDTSGTASSIRKFGLASAGVR
jgi:hypothetical protein